MIPLPQPVPELGRFSWVIAVLFCMGMTIFVGCTRGPAPADVEFLSLVKKTESQYSPLDVRAAALPLFSTNLPASGAPLSQFPEPISTLPILGQSNAPVWISTTMDGKGLVLVSGSGFGHCGIVVCLDENGKQSVTTLRGKVIPWGYGVFFYKDW